MSDARKSLIVASLAVLLILHIFVPVMIVQGGPGDEAPTGTKDAWIVGKVKNGVSGMAVSCKTIKNPGPGSEVLYFNGTTIAQGAFNITVDSNTWGVTETLTPYEITVSPTYYLGLLMNRHILVNFTYSGNVSEVPEGTFETYAFPLSDLTITVYNKTSGQPLESARVELVYGPEIPDPPFILTKATNSTGQVEYLQVRSINTTVDITKPNFLTLPASGDPDWVNVNEGVETLSYFYLTERP
ncbi:MAG: hypothetical protein ACMUHB_06790, partial [Thermoplasmatota archaeon]